MEQSEALGLILEVRRRRRLISLAPKRTVSKKITTKKVDSQISKLTSEQVTDLLRQLGMGGK